LQHLHSAIPQVTGLLLGLHPFCDNRQPHGLGHVDHPVYQPPKKKLSFKEQRELETIEKEMPELEKKRAEILEKLNNEADYEKIATLSAELEKVSEKLEEYEMRWLELQEILN
jgi:hypothetical protein